MPGLEKFDTPAFQEDLKDQPELAEKFAEAWSQIIHRQTKVAILGNPWTVLNDNQRTYYYDPLETDFSATKSALVTWVAFPNRIAINYPGSSLAEQLGFADGIHIDGSFGPPPPIHGEAYSPRGPRGWQDEYCEWIVTKNEAGKITRVDFTCENPEYWQTLWKISPEKVLSLYQELVCPAVKLEDLFLYDKAGTVVIDRATGLPAYNLANKWNNQPSADFQTGAVHLISSPNTLGAQVYLAAAATIARDNPPGTPVTDSDALIRCSRYGGVDRHSDPVIGITVNNAVRQNESLVSLTNPVGLYLQVPNFRSYRLPRDPKLPPGATAADCFHIIRGQESIPGFDGNFILHARFEIPQAWKDAGVSFTVGDISITGDPITFGAQIAKTLSVGLRALPIPTEMPPQRPRSCQAPNPKPFPRPYVLQDLNLFEANATLSGITKIEQGATTPSIALLAINAGEDAVVEFPNGGVSATVTDQKPLGNGLTLLVLTLVAEAQAPLGDQLLLLRNAAGKAGEAAVGLLSIVSPGTLPPPKAEIFAAKMADSLIADLLASVDVSDIILTKTR